MYKDEFLKRIAVALKPANFDAKYEAYYLVVNGCKFDAEEGKKPDVFKFLGSKFKVAADGTFDLPRACGLVIAALPEKLAAKEASSRATKYKELMATFVPGGTKGTQSDERYKTWYPVSASVALSYSAAGVEVKATLPDSPSVQRVLEALKAC